GLRRTHIVGMAELLGTATAATAAAFVGAARSGRLPTGVVLAGDVELDTVSLLADVVAFGVRIQEFVGAA
ncbi:MAG: hypothetical protein ACO3U0_10845, partial [Ilumatobacteraceae bacterium]